MVARIDVPAKQEFRISTRYLQEEGKDAVKYDEEWTKCCEKCSVESSVRE